MRTLNNREFSRLMDKVTKRARRIQEKGTDATQTVAEEFFKFRDSLKDDGGRVRYSALDSTEKRRVSNRLQNFDNFKTMNVKGAKNHRTQMRNLFGDQLDNYSREEMSAIMSHVQSQMEVYEHNNHLNLTSDQFIAAVGFALGDEDRFGFEFYRDNEELMARFADDNMNIFESNERAIESIAHTNRMARFDRQRRLSQQEDYDPWA